MLSFVFFEVFYSNEKCNSNNTLYLENIPVIKKIKILLINIKLLTEFGQFLKILLTYLR